MISRKSRKYSNRKYSNRKYSNRKYSNRKYNQILVGGEIIINNLDELNQLAVSKNLYVYQVSQSRPIFRAILLTNNAKKVEKYVSDVNYTVSYAPTETRLPTRYFINNYDDIKYVTDDHVWEIYDNTDKANPKNFRLRYIRHLTPYLYKRDYTVLYYEENPISPPKMKECNKETDSQNRRLLGCTQQ
jgi:hypothetical protein